MRLNAFVDRVSLSDREKKEKREKGEKGQIQRRIKMVEYKKRKKKKKNMTPYVKSRFEKNGRRRGLPGAIVGTMDTPWRERHEGKRPFNNAD